MVPVDIEFDDINSYHGSTKTIQFTVYDYCFIIDAQILELHTRENPKPLSESLSNFKVFHSTASDRALARDFGISPCGVIQV